MSLLEVYFVINICLLDKWNHYGAIVKHFQPYSITWVNELTITQLKNGPGNSFYFNCFKRNSKFYNILHDLSINSKYLKSLHIWYSEVSLLNALTIVFDNAKLWPTWLPLSLKSSCLNTRTNTSNIPYIHSDF